MPSGTLFFLEKAGKELLSRALWLTPQNLGAKSEPAARADSLCRPVRCFLFFLEKAGKELLSRALRPTPQNLGAKSEPAARAGSLCRPVRCFFLKKQAKNF